MIIVTIMGGLGNQLFQYALVEKLKSMGKDVKVDLSMYEDTIDGITPRESIYNMLKTKYKVATRKEKEGSVWRKTMRRLGKINDIVCEYEPSYKPEVLQINKGRLVGYWQSEKYFSDMRTQIVEAFDFRYYFETNAFSDANEAIEKTRELLDVLSKGDGDITGITRETVALHIRGGDYLNDLNAGTFGGICTREYYCRAIEYIKKRVERPKVYVFTNDKEYAEEIMSGITIDYQYVDWNDECYAYADLLLMSKCKHHVLANSSFSWWAEYLSDQTGITVAPSRWMNDSENRDIYRDNWVVL